MVTVTLAPEELAKLDLLVLREKSSRGKVIARLVDEELKSRRIQNPNIKLGKP